MDQPQCGGDLRSASKQPEALPQSQVAEHFAAEKHAEFLLALIAKQPDLTLDEIVAAMNSAASRAAAARFGGSTTDATSASKKTLYAAEQKRADVAHAAGAGCASKACDPALELDGADLRREPIEVHPSQEPTGRATK